MGLSNHKSLPVCSLGDVSRANSSAGFSISEKFKGLIFVFNLKTTKPQFLGMRNFEEMGRRTREGVEILKDGVLEVKHVPGECISVKALIRAQESQSCQALGSGILDVLSSLPGPDQQMLGVCAPSACQESKQN